MNRVAAAKRPFQVSRRRRLVGMGQVVLPVRNPVSTEVTAESVGSVLVRRAARLEVVAIQTLDLMRSGWAAWRSTRVSMRCSSLAATGPRRGW
jgi:hypothetical protein